MRVLDLFCGAGGAGMGYHRAGYEVVGYDIAKQDQYPFEFHRGDAFDVLSDTGYLRQFDLVHASPPCQGYSRYTRGAQALTPRYIDTVRDYLQDAGLPYVIENVIAARPFMRDPVLLCGWQLGLHIRRHRLFECAFQVSDLWHPACFGLQAQWAHARGYTYRHMSIGGESRGPEMTKFWAALLDAPWITQPSRVTEAIPPVYTQFLGAEFELQVLGTTGISGEKAR